MNLLGVPAVVGGFQGFGGHQNHAVKLAHGGSGLLTLNRLALESIIDRLAEGIPHFLLLFAFDGYALRFVLPALLQRLHGINAQHRFGTQPHGFFDHGLAAGNAVGPGGGQRCVGQVHRGLPLRLDLGKGFFAQVTSFAPLVDKPVQAANLQLPVGAGLVRFSPGQHFVDQDLAFSLDGFGLLLDRLQPHFHDFVSLIAGIVKPFPQSLVGCAALVAGFPLVAHHTQRVLLFATPQWLGQQGLSLDDQLFANLVGTPALPAFQLTRVGQCGVSGGFEFAVNIADVFL